jgi:hypothetical protein
LEFAGVNVCSSCRTFTIELDLNAEARPKDQEKSSDPILEVPKDKDKEKYAGPVASVFDRAAARAALGTSLWRGVAARRFASRRDTRAEQSPPGSPRERDFESAIIQRHHAPRWVAVSVSAECASRRWARWQLGVGIYFVGVWLKYERRNVLQGRENY